MERPGWGTWVSTIERISGNILEILEWNRRTRSGFYGANFGKSFLLKFGCGKGVAAENLYETCLLSEI